MATQPPANLPLFYKDLLPLSSSVHGDWSTRASEGASFFAQTHAVPLACDEFILAQRYYPIVFSVGDNPVPLGLFGLHEGVNVFVDAEGKLQQELYVPAYVRRYPFILARLRQDAEELSLCFDPTSDLVGQFDDGNKLFEDNQPSEATRGILKFCEDFEMASQRTSAFVKELQELDLLIPGEVAISINEGDQPYVYRGFQMVDEAKLRDLRGDTLRKINLNGLLPLIIAHLFSLSLIREVFGRSMAQGKIPMQTGAAVVQS